ncbi:MraY family glycosyltransferase [Thermomonas sp.]|uniref:MraY family glycosyltransferase n=1 Tax=Thermomonas sp. TaxID=1971895 RepID=UPI001D2E7310|nr:MraY family glycosyltransferase [Thermomonas sp.]MBZ0087737.1 undecaprenyl/decaprenyl-phosphate alpha-N-acetylglucosaminyl 1-phosphate transferase [Thermomonas sp.]MCO5054281.1 undecaprenyl/decaprenyl-phosphate alpha-N-acetylglucosaminyl 1-phosphate transferase [Thermomonas sp.]HRO63706.1 MraY family glycosyltransferase [Thermomonas sp.]
MLARFDPTAAVLAFLLTAGAMCLLRPVAHRLDLLDHPQGRKDHAAPTPVTGGIAIFIGCLIAFSLFQNVSDGLQAFSVAALLLVAVGLWDDIHDVRWYWRILAQITAALIIIYWGEVRVEQIGPVFGLSTFSLGWLSVPFTVFATVGIINAMNMIDGADGQAGLLGLAALVMLMAASLYAGNGELAMRVSVLAGGLAGFLVWNLRLPWRPRASAFLGNAGSALLGLVIAWVSFRLTQNPGHPVNPVLALWLLPIPVMDCLVVSVRRMRQGRSPFFADRTHIHHILQDAGFGPTRAALHLTWFSLLCGLLVGQAMRMDVPHPVLLVLFVLLCVGWYALTCKRERAVALFARLRRARPVDSTAVIDVPQQATPVHEHPDRSA